MRLKTFVLLFLFASSLYGEPVTLLFKPFFWQPEFEGTVGVVKKNSPHFRLNLQKDLDLETPNQVSDVDTYFERAAGFEIKLGAASYNLNFEGFQTYDKDVVVLSRSITFGDSTFLAGTPLESKLEFETLSAELEYHLYVGSMLYVGSLVGVKIFSFAFVLSDQNTGVVERESRTATVPYLGLSVSLRLFQYFMIFGRIQGLTSDLDKNAFNVDRYYYLEGSVGVLFRYGFLDFGIEWRKMGLFLTKSDSEEWSEISLKVGGSSQRVHRALRFFIAFRF